MIHWYDWYESNSWFVTRNYSNANNPIAAGLAIAFMLYSSPKGISHVLLVKDLFLVFLDLEYHVISIQTFFDILPFHIKFIHSDVI